MTLSIMTLMKWHSAKDTKHKHTQHNDTQNPKHKDLVHNDIQHYKK
jgi:hypothetical protein